MTPLKQLRAEMRERAEAFYKDPQWVSNRVDAYIDMGHFRRPAEARPYLIDGWCIGIGSVANPRDILALLKALDSAESALEDCECDCEISLPVNDFPRDMTCGRCAALAEIGSTNE